MVRKSTSESYERYVMRVLKMDGKVTVGFSFENEFGDKFSQSSTFEIAYDCGENDADKLGMQFNNFLRQCGYFRSNDYIFMEDVTEEERDALSQYLYELRRRMKKRMIHMKAVGKFEKVSFEQFYEAMKDEFYKNAWKDIDKSNNEEKNYAEFIRAVYERIQLPTRATSGSAGYDFKAYFSFTLPPGTTIKIPTGIRVKIDEGWWLGCLPRSSLGFKYRMQLDNTMGVIDSDYYYSDNEGHIFIKVTNDSNEGKDLKVEAGSGFAQGIFIPYGITYDDDAVGVRNGGMGSTDKQ